jgi:DNA-binding NarL/FixJ family response regulator
MGKRATSDNVVGCGSSTARPTGVLLCDDQVLVRGGFSSLLRSEGGIDVVGQLDDIELVLPTCRRTEPDVVITEIALKGRPVAPLISSLRLDLRIAPKVMVLSAVDEDEAVVTALRAGAVGYLLKSQSVHAVADAIRWVAAGEAVLAPSVTRRLLPHLAALIPAAELEAASGELSRREVDVLRLLAEGMSNTEIARALGVGDATVKSHVSHLLNKLQLRDRVQAAVFAHRSGIVSVMSGGIPGGR